MPTLSTLRWMVRDFTIRRRDKVLMWLARNMPARLQYHVAIGMCAWYTVKVATDKCPSEVKTMEMVRAWEQKLGPVAS